MDPSRIYNANEYKKYSISPEMDARKNPSTRKLKKLNWMLAEYFLQIATPKIKFF